MTKNMTKVRAHRRVNPWAVCHASVGPKKTAKFERCVKNVKASQAFAYSSDRALFNEGRKLGLQEAEDFLDAALDHDDQKYKDARHDLSIAIATKHPEVTRRLLLKKPRVYSHLSDR